MKPSSFNTIWLALTYECNCRCKWCYAASNDLTSSVTKSMDDLILNRAKTLLWDIRPKKVILIGGEPTLYPALDEILKEFKDSDMKIGIVTNGRRLSKEKYLKTLISSGLHFASISIQGPSKEIHEKSTQVPCSFDETVSGIQNAIREGLNFSTNTTINSLNLHAVQDIVVFLSQLGVKDITFNVCNVCLSRNENNSYLVDLKKAAGILDQVFAYATKYSVKIRLITPMPRCLFSKETLETSTESIPSGPCQIMSGRNFVIDYNGDILPCTHLSGFSFFNILSDVMASSKNGFINKYNSQNCVEFRRRIARYPLTTCNTCAKSALKNNMFKSFVVGIGCNSNLHEMDVEPV